MWIKFFIKENVRNETVVMARKREYKRAKNKNFLHSV